MTEAEQPEASPAAASFESAPEPRWIVDAEGRCVDVNAAAAARVGRTRAEMVGRPIHELLPRDDEARERDETALRAAEEKLQQADRLEALGQLAGGIAHEFGNLLAVVLSTSSVLLDELPAQDPTRADVQTIHEAATRATDLTRQLLAFGRRQVLAPRVLELDAVVGRVERVLERVIGEDIALELELGSAGSTVRADAAQLEHVVMNLALNAREAMRSGGSLTIRTAVETVPPDRARTTGVPEGTYAKLVVADTGVGMDAKALTRVFEPFFTTKQRGPGTGLGLSTVFGIVKQSDGHVMVESVPGRGTTVTVFLPATTALPVTRTDEGASASTGTETVLVVEDDERLRRRMRSVLARAGYRVLEGANAGEALLVAEQHDGTVHLLLTDVVMPRVSGFALAKRLLALRPEMRVLYTSGYTDDAELREKVANGEVAFLAKPFDAAALTRKVRETLDAQKT